MIRPLIVSATVAAILTVAYSCPVVSSAQEDSQRQGQTRGTQSDSQDNVAAGLRLFARLDKNSDGKISGDEATAMFWRSFGRFDQNGDGFLTKDEFAKPIQAGRIRFGTRPGGNQRNGNRPAGPGAGVNLDQLATRFLQRNDANGDGKVTLEEANPSLKSRFGTIDANKDGGLDRSEIKSLLTRIIGNRPLQQPGGINTAAISQLEKDYWPSKPRKLGKLPDDVVAAEDVAGDGVWLDPALKNLSAPLVPVTVWFDRQLLGDGDAYARRCQEFSGQLRQALGKRVVNSLKVLSQQSFQRSETQMRKLVQDGQIRLVEWHWIVNGFSCLATKDGLTSLQNIPGVKKVFLARGRFPFTATGGAQPSFFPASQKREFEPHTYKHPWYARYLQADKTWTRLGATGAGTLNVVMDGSFVLSPNVTANLYQNPRELSGNGQDDDGNGLIDDCHGFDFIRGAPLHAARVATSSGFTPGMHGFMCAAIICGTGSENCEYEFGLAPQATWAGVIAGGRIEPALEWAIEQGADALSMSFSLPNLGEYRSHWRKVMEQASLCGLCSASGAGNFAAQGTPSYAPIPVQMRTPEDIPRAVFAPAGVQRDLQRTSFSSQGPVNWETEHYHEGPVQKPDFCAFNSNLPTLLPNGTVRPGGLNGNSFAGPMTAGTLALMLSADPDLLPWDAREIIVQTATDVAAPGMDHQTGAGLINCYRAVKEVLRRKAAREGRDTKPYEGRERDDSLAPTAQGKDQRQRKFVVQRVVPNTVAAQRGVRAGDIALSIDGRTITGLDVVRNAVRKAAKAKVKTLTLAVRRDGKSLEIQLPTPPRGALGIALEQSFPDPVFQ